MEYAPYFDIAILMIIQSFPLLFVRIFSQVLLCT